MVKYELLPDRAEDKEFIEKLKAIVEDRNKAIAKTLGVEVDDELIVRIYGSAGALTGALFEQEKTFAGYKDGANWIALVNPAAANGLFTDLWKECSIITDYALIKYYICQKYFPNKDDFNLYYKYLSEQLALVISGKYQKKLADFHLKVHVEGKRYKKDDQIGLLLYLIREHSGVDFIVSHLDEIVEEKNIEKSLQRIYKKSFEEFLKPEVLRVREEAKKLEEQFRQNRKKFNLKQTENVNNRPQQSKYGYSRNQGGNRGPNGDNDGKKFVSKAKFNPNRNQNSNYNRNNEGNSSQNKDGINRPQNSNGNNNQRKFNNGPRKNFNRKPQVDENGNRVFHKPKVNSNINQE